MSWVRRGLGHRFDRRKLLGRTPDRLGLEHDSDLPAAAPETDLRHAFVTLDQGGAGTCVTHSTVQIVRIDHQRQGNEKPDWLSRRLHYGQASAMQGNFGSDLGLEPRFAWEALRLLGFARESELPYDDQELWSGLTPELEKSAFGNRDKDGLDYCRVDALSDAATLDLIDRFLTSGRAVSWGGLVDNRFCDNAYDWAKPIGPMVRDIAGGHEMVILGHKWIDGKRIYLIGNSWGTGFGFGGGFCWFDEDAVLADSDRRTAWNAPYFKETV